MIYIGTVMPSIMELPKNISIIDFFKQYQPKKIIIPGDVEEQKKIKTQQVEGMISVR